MQDICGKLFDNSGHTFSLIFLKLRPEARVNVTQKQYAALCNPKMYPYTNFLIPTLHNIQILLDLSRTETRDQGHKYPKTVGGMHQPIDVSTHQI